VASGEFCSFPVFCSVDLGVADWAKLLDGTGRNGSRRVRKGGNTETAGEIGAVIFPRRSRWNWGVGMRVPTFATVEDIDSTDLVL
jgi:hypothetical protein